MRVTDATRATTRDESETVAATAAAAAGVSPLTPSLTKNTQIKIIS